MTDSAELKSRLDTAVKKRDELSQKKQRILGRIEEAERSLEALREECRSKNIDPDKIDDVILKLTQTLETSVTQLETKLSDAEKSLEPYVSPRK